MKIVKVQYQTGELPFLEPFQTSYGVTKTKSFAIVTVEDESGLVGIGELDALVTPDYIEETFQTSLLALDNWLIPSLVGQEWEHPKEVFELFATTQGFLMAKSALETACWDLFAKKEQSSLAAVLKGAPILDEAIEVGVSIGIILDLDSLVQKVATYLDQGYTRVKLKIKPGYDLEPLRVLRQAFPRLILMADANSAYEHLDDWDLFHQLDRLNLAMIEQPFAKHDFVRHAQLQQQLNTAICLDENIRSLDDAKTAMALGSCRAVNLKIPRVGGIQPAREILAYLQQQDCLVWLGGMYEAGVGRAVNLQFSAFANFTYPGDLSASDRYFAEDIVTPKAEIHRGKLAIPQGVGIGVTLDSNIYKS